MVHSEFVGVDWCKGGWFSVGFAGSGEYELKVFRKFGELLDCYKETKLILVDIPIGLPDGKEERAGDIEAKKLLARKRDWCVFRAPTRAATEHFANYPCDRKGAKDVQSKVTGESLSDQTLDIMPQIIDVDSVLSTRATNAAPQVREVHPEILFWALNDEKPMPMVHKSTLKGKAKRISVLNQVEPRTEGILRRAREKYPNSQCVKDDDILDALAAAVTAQNGYPDKFQTLPPRKVYGSPMQKDKKKDLPMEMVYWAP